MTEMNELTRSLVRVEELIKNGENADALNCLWISQNHALSAVKLIKDQSSAMTEQALKIKELTERMAYWQQRAEYADAEVNQQEDQIAQLQQWLESAEAEIKELDEQEQVGACMVWNAGGSGEFKELIGLDNLIDGQQVYARPVPTHKFELEIQRLVAMNDSLLANEKRLIEGLRLARSNHVPEKSAPDGESHE